MAVRQCPYCGKALPDHWTQCPHCRETLEPRPEVRVASTTRRRTDGRGQIRRGLLFMLLAGIIHYVAGGYSGMELPFPIRPVVTVYLSPLLFLSGLGLSLHGLYLRRKT